MRQHRGAEKKGGRRLCFVKSAAKLNQTGETVECAGSAGRIYTGTITMITMNITMEVTKMKRINPKILARMTYNERLAMLQTHYLGAYKARIRMRTRLPRGIKPGTEAAKVYLTGRW